MDLDESSRAGSSSLETVNFFGGDHGNPLEGNGQGYESVSSVHGVGINREQRRFGPMLGALRGEFRLWLIRTTLMNQAAEAAFIFTIARLLSVSEFGAGCHQRGNDLDLSCRLPPDYLRGCLRMQAHL